APWHIACIVQTGSLIREEGELRNYFEMTVGDSPVITIAQHGGSSLRFDLADNLILTPQQKRREEDPETIYWSEISPSRIFTHVSRFEADLNRTRDEAVYESAEKAWGLDLWRRPLTSQQIQQSLLYYDRFYSSL